MSLRDDFNKTDVIRGKIAQQKGNAFTVSTIFEALSKNIRGDEITRSDVSTILGKLQASGDLVRTARGEYIGANNQSQVETE